MFKASGDMRVGSLVFASFLVENIFFDKFNRRPKGRRFFLYL